MFEDKLIFEAFVYNFLLLVILVKLLMFDLETSWEGNVVLEVIVKEGWRNLLETSIGVVTVLGFGMN